MASSIAEVVAEIQTFSPEVKYFLIGCEAAAEEAIRKAASDRPRAERAAFRRTQIRRWRRRVDQITSKAPSIPPEEVLSAVAELPYGGLACVQTGEEAENLADRYSAFIPHKSLVGMHEQIIAPAVAIIWLWRDS